MTAHRTRTRDLAVQVLAATAAILAIAEPAVARVLLTVLLAAAAAVAILVVIGAGEFACWVMGGTFCRWRDRRRARRRAARRAGYLYGGPR